MTNPDFVGTGNKSLVYHSKQQATNIFNFNYFSMYLTKENKKEIIDIHKKAESDTGSPEIQIALFTYRINHLTEHLKTHKKDFNTQRALTVLVGKRKKLLNYLCKTDIERYRAIISKLKLRK